MRRPRAIRFQRTTGYSWAQHEIIPITDASSTNNETGIKCGRETLPKDTRALGRSSRCTVASFAIAVTTKHSSLDWDECLDVSPRVDSCPKPRRLCQCIEIRSAENPLSRMNTVHFMKVRVCNNIGAYLDERFSYKSSSRFSKSSLAASFWDEPPPPNSPMAQHSCSASSVWMTHCCSLSL